MPKCSKRLLRAKKKQGSFFCSFLILFSEDCSFIILGEKKNQQ